VKRPADPLAYGDKAARTLAAARLLLDSGDTEGACNRAYYAMYYAAQAALLAAGLAEPENGYKTHQGLIGEFGKHLVLGGKLDQCLGRSINKVQHLRQLADYTGDPLPLEDATSAVTQAEVFVAAIRTRFKFEKIEFSGSIRYQLSGYLGGLLGSGAI
jgi:uncharacterized protein (UPF0332 family)